MQTSHLGRPIDLSYPSNRHAILLATSSSACYAAAGLLRPAPPEGDEGELVLALDVGDRSFYGRAARLVLSLGGDPVLGTRVLRVLQAVGGAGAVLATWALARELLPDQPELAAPAAALVAVQPAVWQAASEVDPAVLTLGEAMVTLVTATRVATRSTGLPPTQLDCAFLAVIAGQATLIDPRLAWLPLVAAATLAYDAARDGRPAAAAARGGIVLAAGAGASVLARRTLRPPRRRRLRPVARVALQATMAAGAIGLVVLAALTPRETIRSRADNGAPLPREGVLLARALALAWAVLAAATHSRMSLHVLPPLAIAAVAGPWRLLRHGR